MRAPSPRRAGRILSVWLGLLGLATACTNGTSTALSLREEEVPGDPLVEETLDAGMPDEATMPPPESTDAAAPSVDAMPPSGPTGMVPPEWRLVRECLRLAATWPEEDAEDAAKLIKEFNALRASMACGPREAANPLVPSPELECLARLRLRERGSPKPSNSPSFSYGTESRDDSGAVVELVIANATSVSSILNGLRGRRDIVCDLLTRPATLLAGAARSGQLWAAYFFVESDPTKNHAGPGRP